MNNFKQPKELKEKNFFLKNVNEKNIGGIILIAIMIIAFAILSVQQIGDIKSIAQESALALEDNQKEITIIKSDKKTGEVLSGAVFKVELNDFFTGNQVVGEYTTDEEGKIQFLIELGCSYTITEITAPSGYKMLESSIILDYNPFGFVNVSGVTNEEAEYVDGVIYIYNESNESDENKEKTQVVINRVRRRW